MSIPERLNDYRLWLLGAVAGLLLIAAMAPPNAAACNSPLAKRASDPSFACITTRAGTGPSLDFCDRDADNHYVYARFVDSHFTGPNRWASTANLFGFPRGYDGNGSASGCGHLGLLSGKFYAWMVCIQVEGCSGWAYYPPPPPGIWARRW